MISCEHLQELEAAIQQDGIAIVQTGDWWNKGSDRNIYFMCYLDQTEILRRFQFPDFVKYREWSGRTAGHEAGFYCKKCQSSVVGNHPRYAEKVWP